MPDPILIATHTFTGPLWFHPFIGLREVGGGIDIVAEKREARSVRSFIWVGGLVFGGEVDMIRPAICITMR